MKSWHNSANATRCQIYKQCSIWRELIRDTTFVIAHMLTQSHEFLVTSPQYHATPVCSAINLSYEVAQIWLSVQGFKTRSVTRYSTYYKVSQGITKYHKASQGITKYHKAIRRHHKYHKVSQSMYEIFLRVNWRAWILFHLIFRCTNIFFVLRPPPP